MKSMLACLFFAFVLFESSAQTKAFVYNSSGISMPVRKKPDADSKEITRCESRDTVLLLSYSGGQYYKIKTLKLDSVVGYIHINFLTSDSISVSNINKYNRVNNPSYRMEFTPLREDRKKHDVTPTSYPSYDNSSRSSGGTSTVYKDIQTGPRGGHYYINSHGKKTYVKRK